MSSPSSAFAADVAFGGSKNELIITAWTVLSGLIVRAPRSRPLTSLKAVAVGKAPM